MIKMIPRNSIKAANAVVLEKLSPRAWNKLIDIFATFLLQGRTLFIKFLIIQTRIKKC